MTCRYVSSTCHCALTADVPSVGVTSAQDNAGDDQTWTSDHVLQLTETDLEVVLKISFGSVLPTCMRTQGLGLHAGSSFGPQQLHLLSFGRC